MATSTAPAVKAALLPLLKARPALAGVQITRGHPGDTLERELILIGTVRGNQEWGALGARAKDEAYTVDITIDVVRDGDDIQDQVTDRAYALLAELENALRADPTLNGVLTRQAHVASWTEDEALTDVGRQTVITAQVACTARI